jgi:ABC-2 type transport system ATP-binding protein
MGKCLMISSHILSELGEMSTSIGIIERGKLLFSGSLQDAFARARGGERICVKLEAEGTGPAAVRERLQTDHRVARVHGPTDDAPQELTVELLPGEHGHHFVLEALVGCGARVSSFTPQEMKLEDAFLRLTTGALQ